MYSVYSINFLKWLNSWLWKGSYPHKKNLINKLSKFDVSNYRCCDTYLYRVSDFKIKLEGKKISTAVLNRKIPIGISSWSFNYDIVKKFHPILLKETEGINYIMEYKPKKEDIILNINQLLSETKFNMYMRKNMHIIPDYKQGLYKYRNKQKEVILNIPYMPIYNIIELGFYNEKYMQYFKEKYPFPLKGYSYEDQLNLLFRGKLFQDNIWSKNEVIKKLEITTKKIFIKNLYVYSNEYIKEVIG